MALRAGRRQSTPGLNWYVGSNIQFMFDYVKQMGARSAGNPHAACDVEGAGNVEVGMPDQLARQSSTLPGKPFFVPSPAIRFPECAEGVRDRNA